MRTDLETRLLLYTLHVHEWSEAIMPKVRSALGQNIQGPLNFKEWVELTNKDPEFNQLVSELMESSKTLDIEEYPKRQRDLEAEEFIRTVHPRLKKWY